MSLLWGNFLHCLRPRGKCALLFHQSQTITVRRPLGLCLLSGEAKMYKYLRKQHISQQMNLVYDLKKRKMCDKMLASYPNRLRSDIKIMTCLNIIACSNSSSKQGSVTLHQTLSNGLQNMHTSGSVSRI